MSLNLADVQKELQKLLEFLMPYLPIANAHATDFITKQHWQFLPSLIQDELLILSKDEMKCLPFHTCPSPSKSCHVNDQHAGHNSLGGLSNCASSTCHIVVSEQSTAMCTEQAQAMAISPNGFETASALSTSNELTQRCQINMPTSLAKLCQLARKHSLDDSRLHVSVDDLLKAIEYTSDGNFINAHLTTKKCHEVEIMSDVCAALARHTDSDLVVDFGSGKGYLSHNLVLQHSVSVLGIDARQGNTTSAAKRKEMLDKQWLALERNKKLSSANKKLTKKDKKQLRMKHKEMKKQENNADIEENQGSHGDVTDLSLESNGEKLRKPAQSKNVTSDIDTGFHGKPNKVTSDVDNSFRGQPNKATSDVNGIVTDSSVNVTYTDENKPSSHNETTKFSISNDLNGGTISNNALQTGECSDKRWTEARFIPCTMFIDRNTNFRELAVSNFPDILHRCKSDIQNKQDSSVDSQIKDVTNAVQNIHLETGDDQSKDDATSGFQDKNASNVVDQSTEDVSNNMQNYRNSGCCNASCFEANDTQKEDTQKEARLCLTGLHTCGNLASTSMLVFTHNADFKAMCNVGCCYHLLTEAFLEDSHSAQAEGDRLPTATAGFPLSQYLYKNRVCLGTTARNLASQSIHRNAQSDELQGERFYARALLEVLVNEVCGVGTVKWTGLRKLEQKSSSVQDYIRRAAVKLHVSDKITDSIIDAYIEKYKEERFKLTAFFQLRTVLAPCIEAVLLLDRLCYLLEQDTVDRVYLVKLFDEVTSPRCYGIIAVK